MGKDEKGAYRNSVLSVQYFCKLKTALKIVFFFFFFCAALCTLQDLSSLTRDHIQSSAVEARNPNHGTTRECLKQSICLKSTDCLTYSYC